MFVGDEVDEMAPGDVEFQRPLEDGEPEDGRPEEGSPDEGMPDAGYVGEGVLEDAGIDSGALALDEGSLEDPVLTNDEADGVTPGDVEFQRPLEDARPEEGRPEDGKFEGGYSEDIGAVDDAGPVVRGTEADEVDSAPETVLDSELPDDTGPVVNGTDSDELGLVLSDDDAFHDGPLDDGRLETGRLDDNEDEDDLVCLEKDEEDGVGDDVEDCG